MVQSRDEIRQTSKQADLLCKVECFEMIMLFCRKRAKDYIVWKQIFDANLTAAREAGLEGEYCFLK